MAATPPLTGVTPPDDTPTCPRWCRTHLQTESTPTLHRLVLGEMWGSTTRAAGEEKLSLALEWSDGEDEPRLSFRFSQDGQLIDGSVDVPLSTADGLLFSALSLVAQGRENVVPIRMSA